MTILGVEDFTSLIKNILESSFGKLTIKGEVSQISTSTKGHTYITLAENNSFLNAVFWKGKSLPKDLKVGSEIICMGQITTYQSRYQLSINEIYLSGIGDLFLIMQERKMKLEKEGLFSQEHKKSLPRFPSSIGVITSAKGAVLHDIQNRILNRFPTKLLIWSVPVQGFGSAEKIKEAIEGLNKLKNKKPDLIILARGGGSAEELWTFNEELVVRSIYESSIPIISAIGHQTDYTLSDFAADIRAPTPSAAAEIAVPDKLELINIFSNFKARIDNSIKNEIHNKAMFLQKLYIPNPSKIIELHSKTLEHQKKYITSLTIAQINDRQNKLQNASKFLSMINNGFAIVYNESGDMINSRYQNKKIKIAWGDKLRNATLD